MMVLKIHHSITKNDNFYNIVFKNCSNLRGWGSLQHNYNDESGEQYLRDHFQSKKGCFHLIFKQILSKLLKCCKKQMHKA